jgi:hypothetical protein
MNNENEDRELQKLFRELRRSEANQSPSFARVCRPSTARERTPPAVLWRYALGTALAAVALFVAATVVFRSPTTMTLPPAGQPDAAALAAAALQTVLTWPDEPPAPARWDSPTAFLLSPLAAGSVPANSGNN